MWDNNAPLQLLKTMPSKLNQDNLEKIQMLLDADKYKNSIISGFDLCGIFAPFCRGCDKTSIYPCAISYIRMLQSEGMKIEIDASPAKCCETKPYKQSIQIPKNQPRSVSVSYEQRSLRNPVDKKYGEIRTKLSEAAVTEDEKTNELNLTEEKPVAENTEIKVDSIVETETVVTSVEQTSEVKVEKPEKTEKLEKVEKHDAVIEKPQNSSKLRIAVARRKLNI